MLSADGTRSEPLLNKCAKEPLSISASTCVVVVVLSFPQLFFEKETDSCAVDDK